MSVYQILAAYAAVVGVAITACYLDLRFLNGQGKLSVFMLLAIVLTIYFFFKGPIFFVAACCGTAAMWLSVKAIFNKFS